MLVILLLKTTSKILSTLRNTTLLEQKRIGYEPKYEGSYIIDDLHDIFKFNTDYEITSYKKIKKFLTLIYKLESTHF